MSFLEDFDPDEEIQREMERMAEEDEYFERKNEEERLEAYEDR